MSLLLNLLKNRYLLITLSILIIYILDLILYGVFSHVDCVFLIFIIFIEFCRGRELAVSLLTGFLEDILYSPVIGIFTLFYFFLFIFKNIYARFVDYNNAGTRLILYIILTLLYINFNLILYTFPLTAYIHYNLIHFMLDFAVIVLLFILKGRDSFAI